MSDLITVTGVVLSAMPIGEYDKRVVLLTKERGKISAFARGARRSNSPLLAACNPFVFGTFSLYEGRSSYNLTQASVKHYFTELARMQPGVYYGFYFLELADYYGKENVDEMQMINLLYVTVKALLNPHIDDRLIRRIFELRMLVIQGEYPQMFSCCDCGATEKLTHFSENKKGMLCAECAKKQKDSEAVDESTLYAIQYIIHVPVSRLYTFAVSEQVQKRLDHFVSRWMIWQLDRRLKSQSILEMML